MREAYQGDDLQESRSREGHCEQHDGRIVPRGRAKLSKKLRRVDEDGMRFECACDGSAADEGGQCLVGDWESPARGRGSCRGWTLLALLSDTEQSETDGREEG